MNKYLFCLAASLLLVTSCGQSPEKARQELTKIGIQYTDEAFQTAIKKKDKIAIDLFLASEHDASFILKDAIEIYTKPENKNVDLIKKLIDRSSNSQVSHKWVVGYITPLGEAVKSENTEIIKLLLDKGADINNNEGEALRNALFEQTNLKTADLLIERGADINIKYENQSLLYHSIIKDSLDKTLNQKDNEGVTNYIIQQGINVNDGKNGHSYSLVIAVEENNKELVETLLKKGANINSTWQNPNDIAMLLGVTPKQYTLYDIAKDKPEIVAILNKYAEQQKQAQK